MTKRRFFGPVKVETRRNRSRKREPRTPAQPTIVVQPPAAPIGPRPGALADEFAQIFRHGRVPKWMWSPASA